MAERIEVLMLLLSERSDGDRCVEDVLQRRLPIRSSTADT
jgi:hypothetical protein